MQVSPIFGRVFIHPRWCRISSINIMGCKNIKWMIVLFKCVTFLTDIKSEKSEHWYVHSIQPNFTKSENKVNSTGLNPLPMTSITSSEPYFLSTQPAFTIVFSHLLEISQRSTHAPRSGGKPPVSLVAWSWTHAPNARCLLVSIDSLCRIWQLETNNQWESGSTMICMTSSHSQFTTSQHQVSTGFVCLFHRVKREEGIHCLLNFFLEDMTSIKLMTQKWSPAAPNLKILTSNMDTVCVVLRGPVLSNIDAVGA